MPSLAHPSPGPAVGGRLRDPMSLAKPDLAALRIDRPATSYGGEGPTGSRWPGLLVALLVGAALARLPLPFPTGPGGDGPRTVRVVRLARSRPNAGTVRGMAANGYVVAARRAALSADTPGRIVELLVAEGAAVTTGTLVARLFPDEYAAAKRRAEADRDAAVASLARSRLGVDSARKEVSRLEAELAYAGAEVRAQAAAAALAEQEQGRIEALAERKAADQRELDRVRSARDGAAARLDQAKARESASRAAVDQGKTQLALAIAQVEFENARVAQASAAVDQAAATLEKTEIRAPFTGVVVLKDAEVGEVVSPNVTGGASSRGSIVTMVDPASFEVQAEVPETSLKAVRLGGAVRIFLDADPERPIPGRVSRIWPTANRQKATVEVRVSFEGPEDGLRPDMGVRAVFLPADAGAEGDTATPPGLPLPPGTLSRREGATGVFVVEGGKASFRIVKVGGGPAGPPTALAGVDDGDRVVVDPPADLADGERVKAEEG